MPLPNEECCFYVSQSGLVRDMTQQLHDRVAHRRQELANSGGNWCNVWGWAAWLLPFTSPLLMILLELLFHPCIINLITHFISSQMKSTKLQLLVTQYRPLDQQKANGNVRCPFHVRKSIEREGMKRKIIQSRPRPSGPSR